MKTKNLLFPKFNVYPAVSNIIRLPVKMQVLRALLKGLLVEPGEAFNVVRFCNTDNFAEVGDVL